MLGRRQYGADELQQLVDRRELCGATGLHVLDAAPQAPGLLEATRVMAHQLSGSASTFGYHKVAYIAREVESRVIGELVANKLRDLDDIAYVRFASEYYQFRSVGDIMKQLEDLSARVRDVKDQQPLFPAEERKK